MDCHKRIIGMNRLVVVRRFLSSSHSVPMTHSNAVSTWSAVPLGPPDAILGITEAYKADPYPGKINLGVGAYRDEKGKPMVLSCVRKAEELMLKQNMDKEYAGITGVPDFVGASVKLAYGADSPAL